jgi:uncharacterized cupin superfamily protein
VAARRQLRAGDVAHQVLNRSGEPVRYLMVAAHGVLDIIEHADERRVLAYSHRPSLLGDERLVVSHELTPEER